MRNKFRIVFNPHLEPFSESGYYLPQVKYGWWPFWYPLSAPVTDKDVAEKIIDGYTREYTPR